MIGDGRQAGKRVIILSARPLEPSYIMVFI